MDQPSSSSKSPAPNARWTSSTSLHDGVVLRARRVAAGPPQNRTCSALACLHSSALMHSDVRPTNGLFADERRSSSKLASLDVSAGCRGVETELGHTWSTDMLDCVDAWLHRWLGEVAGHVRLLLRQGFHVGGELHKLGVRWAEVDDAIDGHELNRCRR